MSDFEIAFSYMLPHEGGYVNDPKDLGGETKYGISKRSYPSVDIHALTLDQAKYIYKTDFWYPYHFNQIENQELANKVFDIAVNIGPRNAVKILQDSLGFCGLPCEVDGILGHETIKLVNQCEAGNLLIIFKDQAASHYRKLCEKNRSLLRFLGGWLARVGDTAQTDSQADGEK